MDKQMDKILKNRNFIESICLGSFLKNLTFYREYKVSIDDFRYDETVFFFSLGKAMSERYQELDENTVLSFLQNNKKALEEYEDYGGWESIETAMELANINNMDAYVDDLAKNNLLINLREKGFNITGEITMDNGKKIRPFDDLFDSYTARDVENFYEGLLGKCSVESISQQVKMENVIFTKEDREKLKEKEHAGTPYDIMFSYTEKEIGVSDDEKERYIYSLPMLSSITNGLHNGNGNTQVLAHSNVGKSSITFFNFILPLIYRGESVIIVLNEQDRIYFSTMLYSFIASNVFKYYNLTRKKITNGDFNEKEERLMEDISQFLIERGFEDNLKFVTMESFNVDEVIRICKPLICHQGFSTILIDTMKAQDSSATNYVGAMTEAVKKLDYFGNKYKVKVLLTQQLTSSTEMQNAYLTSAEISECKSVKTVSDILLLMRKVVNNLELDEKNKDYFLRPYKLVKSDVTGKWSKRYITFTPDEIKNNYYRLIFVNKNRWGQADDIILVRFDGLTGRFTEVGQCEHCSRKTFTQGKRY